MESQQNHSVSGQAILPDLVPEFGFGSTAGLKPQHERFCWEFGLNNGNAKSAYLKSYPGSKEASALANACRLLKSDRIQQRISEIRAELNRRYSVDASKVIQHLSMSLQVDRRQFVSEEGKPLDIHELPPEAAAIADLEIVTDRNGTKRAVTVVPDRTRAAVELAKIIGISGKDATCENSVNIYLPSDRESIHITDSVDQTRFKSLRERAEELKAQGVIY